MKPKRKPEADADPVTQLDSRSHEDTVLGSLSQSRSEPRMWFDSEAAAGEVTRVRKSLAEKREARSMLREYEDEQPLKPPAELQKPPGLSNAPAAGVAPRVVHEQEKEHAPIPQQAPERVLVDEPVSAPVSVEVVSLAPFITSVPVVMPTPEPESETIPKDIPIAEPTPVDREAQAVTEHTEPAQEPEYPSLEVDYAVTLALAQESADLDLWSEARELANEVLELGGLKLKDPALALLQRIEAFEKQQVLFAQMFDNGT